MFVRVLQVNNCPSDHLPTSSIHTVALFIRCALKVMVHGAMEGSKASMLTAVITRMVTHVAMLIIVSHVAMVLPAMIMTYS